MLKRMAKAVKNLSRATEVASCIAHSSDWPSLTAAYLGVRSLEYPTLFSTRSGDCLKLETFHDLVTAWIIFFRPEYMVQSSDRVIIDAGANIGAFSIYAARAAPLARVLALEPFPDTRLRLEANLALNRLDSRVAVRPWALGGHTGTKYMEDNAAVPSQSRGAMNVASKSYSVSVQTRTLLEVFELEEIEGVDLLKMDIEGGEHEVLPAVPTDVWRRIGRIALEYHPGGSKESIFATLRDAGFQLTKDLEVGPDSGVAHFLRPRWSASDIRLR